MAESNITADQVRRLFYYDQTSGHFVRLVAMGKRFKAGSAVGGAKINGYINITIDKRYYLAHRIAWLWMTGKWPKDQIDHIDRNRSNNSWGNLRQATNGQNGQNKLIGKRNTSGVAGVHFCNTKKKWRANIWICGKTISLGYHSTIEAAASARQRAELHYTHRPRLQVEP